MERGAPNYVGLLLGVAYKPVWYTSRHGVLNSMVDKSALVGNKSSSPVSGGFYQATLGRAM